MNSEILKQFAELNKRFERQEKEYNKRFERQEKEITILKERMNRMYDGWKKTKSDLAKLTIRLVQRDDLQKILKSTNRSKAVTTSRPDLKKYFERSRGTGKSSLGQLKTHLHTTVGHNLIKQEGVENKIHKWLNNAERKKSNPSFRQTNYMRSPATSISSIARNNVTMKTFKPIRSAYKGHPSWQSNTKSTRPASYYTQSASSESQCHLANHLINSIKRDNVCPISVFILFIKHTATVFIDIDLYRQK